MRLFMILTCLTLLLAAPLLADTYTQDFESGNDESWTFGNTIYEEIQAEGGNPGSWLYRTYNDTFGPILSHAHDTGAFAGDYVAENVTRISGDFITPYCAFPITDRPFCLMLRDDQGTPDDDMDDIVVFTDPSARFAPLVDDGWVHHDFDIPSDFQGAAGEVPDGWIGGGPDGLGELPAGVCFLDVLSNVSAVEFLWCDPGAMYIMCIWESGADNLEIEKGESVATRSCSLSDVKALFD